ncbi:MAG: hypothetical protein WEA36_10775 [Balneolaceae bacterium]
MSQKGLLFRYKGENSSIDLNTLLTTQFHYAAILDEICSKVAPNHRFKITINGFQKKSFGVEQLIELVAVGSLPFGANKDEIKTILKLLGEYIQIKLVLNGEKADEDQIEKVGNNIRITGHNNNLTIVTTEAFNFYNENTTLDEATRKAAEALDRDEEIDGVEISDSESNEPIIDIGRNDFGILKQPNKNFSEKESVEEIREDQIMHIKRFDYEPQKTTRFSFIYHDRKTNGVTISDEDFLEEVRQGARFGNGDGLRVRLKVKKDRDKMADVFVEVGYDILKVYEIIKREQQGDLGLS